MLHVICPVLLQTAAASPPVADTGTAPGYKGVPDAPRLVGEYLYAASSSLEPAARA